MAARGIFSYAIIATAKVNSNLIPLILSPNGVRCTTHLKTETQLKNKHCELLRSGIWDGQARCVGASVLDIASASNLDYRQAKAEGCALPFNGLEIN
jgi:hypothetical protein